MRSSTPYFHLRTALIVALLCCAIFLTLFLCISIREPAAPETHEAEMTGTGVVLRYLSNAAGDIDKMLVSQNTDSAIFHFPPHVANQMEKIAPAGTDITFTTKAGRHKKDISVPEVVKITAVRSGEMITLKDFPPPPPDAGFKISLQGKPDLFINDDKGNIRGFRIDTTLIDAGPRLAPLLDRIRASEIIEIVGTKRSNDGGRINIYGRSVVHPQYIVIDSIRYYID